MQLELSSYTVPETYCRANRDNASSEIDRPPVVKTLVSHIYDEDDIEIAVSLNVTNKDDVTEEDPYEFDIEVFGVFKVELEDGDSLSNIEHAYPSLVVNAARILYSGARDYLHTITGKAPFGAITLPTGYFSQKGIDFITSKDD
ncbi:Preprotein translocase subunit SecB [Marinobacter sp. LV10R510-11A]|uniref:protein-export chaperone SecB n=1 Tax=Marinobacter sp. LV10R510-11A TaxID=1415568 RepID=UPI000BB7537E|nr:protein-export chaperone SecB [Marinobacter sp. LV10R510-11A]SOB76148.1 Preprotein translocase subunit SecB [Marinobacter sp. LV10R510-11A]